MRKALVRAFVRRAAPLFAVALLVSLFFHSPASAEKRTPATLPVAAAPANGTPRQKEKSPPQKIAKSAAEAGKAGPVRAEPGPANAGSPKKTEAKKTAAAKTLPAAARPAASPGPEKKKATRSQVKGFGDNPFALDFRSGPDAKKSARKKISYGPETQNEETVSFGGGKVTVSGGGPDKHEDRFTPSHKVFPGAAHTLSRMDDETSPEVSMKYNLHEKASTRLVVNPQDENSPIYRPSQGDDSVNAAGLYMDVEVKPNLQLQFGGEYSDDNSKTSGDGSSRGASVGLRLNF